MGWLNVHLFLGYIQQTVSLIGILIIVTGVFICLAQYVHAAVAGQITSATSNINDIRLHLGRVLILGLEFIVAADLIGTTTTPDYYDVGLLAIIVLIRTVLSFSINRELMSISKE